MKHVIGAAICAVMASGAAASDFEFAVPVQLVNLPDGAAPVVSCLAFTEDKETVLGLGKTPVPTNGAKNYSGTVMVNFDFSDPITPAGLTLQDATQYHCHIVLSPSVDSVALTWERCEEVGRPPADNKLICGAKGAPVTSIVTGRF